MQNSRETREAKRRAGVPAMPLASSSPRAVGAQKGGAKPSTKSAKSPKPAQSQKVLMGAKAGKAGKADKRAASAATADPRPHPSKALVRRGSKKAATVTGLSPDALAKADPMEGIPLPSPDEPLVAICRQYLTVGLPVADVLKAFLRDRTIIRICHRQTYIYRLPEPDAAELLHELGILFYRKLLPRLRDPEAIWSVCALTAKRLASGMAARRREFPLEEMGSATDTGGRYEVDDRATAVADRLLQDNLEGNAQEEAAVARIDKERAVSELANLLQRAPASTAKRDLAAEDELRRSITFGPPGTPDPRFADPARTSPVVRVLFDPVAVLPLAPHDQPGDTPETERMPPSYGKRLVKVRDELGMTQKDLAASLGISESSCAQYMACAHGMPRLIWEEVLELDAQGGPRRRHLRQMFDHLQIKDILAQWKKRVQQIEPDCEVTLVDIARIVGVNKSTVSRWAKNEQRPALDRLGEMEDAIQRWLEVAKSKKRSTRKRAA